MNTSRIDPTEISADHERWETDHVKWLRDVFRWQKKHKLALDELERMKAIIADHADAVSHHVDRIVAHEKTLAHHARVMRETASSDDLDDPMSTCHQNVAVAHAQTNDLHARLKERLADVMHQLRELSWIAGQKI